MGFASLNPSFELMRLHRNGVPLMSQGRVISRTSGKYVR
jgi:hypothetical protein